MARLDGCAFILPVRMPEMTSPAANARDTFWRPLHALNITRLVIASLLFVFWGLGHSQSPQPAGPFSFFNICAAYIGLALFFALLALFERRNFLSQLLSQILVDIGFICILYIVAGGMKGGMAILFLFPLASAAILIQLVLALFFTSLVTIFLLVDTFSRYFHGQPNTSIMQAGLYGSAFFATVFFVNRLAARLINQENLARQRGQDLQTQEAVNHLVIAEMDDGVMVVGDDGSIFTCNPAAEHMLGLSLPKRPHVLKFSDVVYLKPLADAFFAWQASRQTPRPAASPAHDEQTVYLVIKAADEPLTTTLMHRSPLPPLGTHLRVRFASAASSPLPKNLSVLFLQDIANIDERAQQLKLASMGRLTASIAHEVRNPLAAISHASALFGEDAQAPTQQRLLKIVSDNVARINRMVEDILNLSRKVQSQGPVKLAEIVTELKTSFDEIHKLPPNTIITAIPDRYSVRFDPVHLREVILNLLTNAMRYASGKPGCIRIFTIQATPTRLELHVQDDGPPISSKVRAHLFEPFYTTSRQGTGLGLYLARELCSNNGAMLDYEFHAGPASPDSPTGRFVITFPTAALSEEDLSQ